jgi:hypothetical protein
MPGVDTFPIVRARPDASTAPEVIIHAGPHLAVARRVVQASKGLVAMSSQLEF